MKKIKEILNKKGEIFTAAAVTACVAILVVIATNINWNSDIKDLDNENKNNIGSESGNQNLVMKDEEIILPTFKSKKEILDKVAQKSNENRDYWFATNDSVDLALPENIQTTEGALKGDSSVSTDSSNVVNKDYSETNTQVQGVDEGDIVKTNGDFVYYLSQNRLHIFDTKTNKTKLVKTILMENANYYDTHEMYIDDNYIVVLAQENITKNEKENLKNNLEKRIVDYYYPIYSTSGTTMYVYDIDSYELVKTVTTEGSYISSRKIDNNIYIVTNKYIYPYSVTEDNILPIYKEVDYLTKNTDKTEVNEFVEIPATEICYFPDMEEKKECSYMIITSLDLNNMDEKANIDTYLGAGNEIYCSKENLYVTKIEYKAQMYGGFIGIATNVAVETTEASSVNENEEENVKTRIHKFKLLDGAVSYVATGEVGGALLNQYSMDEFDGYFRITTTSNIGNSLYVLNSDLENVGELKGLAKGEKIYATRFMGDKCYVVTYKTVDPLFVIDLSTPSNPIVLGELKIPGYSTYLHPLGENYLIGFGEDSVEKSYLNWRGEQEVTAYNIGMKLAIFDISDLNNPKELHSIKIGGRGSSSELLYNPRVLYFDEESGIFALPATLTEETKFYKDGTPMYGDVVFEGALVYNLDVEDGISLRGKIEHDKPAEKYYNANIERIIRIRDNFYTLSSNMLKVTNIENMNEVDKVQIEESNLKGIKEMELMIN